MGKTAMLFGGGNDKVMICMRKTDALSKYGIDLYLYFTGDGPNKDEKYTIVDNVYRINGFGKPIVW